MSSSDEESLVNAMKSIFAYRNNVVIRREVEEQNEAQSSRRKRRYIRRDRIEAHNRLMNDYFVQNPKYPPEYFKWRYRMSQSLLEKIIEGILSYSTRPDAPKWFTYFQQRPDARGVLGVSTILKVTTAIRQLAYGDSPDLFDKYLQISDRTSRHFTRGDHGYPKIMLEAVASYDNWIWHAYFGMAGSNNDLNVLNASPLFDSLLTDTAPQVPYEIGDVDFDRGYYLADGIYPSWASFVKGFSSVVDAKRKYFTKKQSAARKDVKRTIEILQGR
ncbi:uncharacterized protein [Rutidosis leptorrhynchoides]|uniref:uncharacterized protein n=1 Tax=Rutidosis leptorrhynchoides TaxID=125765 RepID=UPI003A99D5D1